MSHKLTSDAKLKELLLKGDGAFWRELFLRTEAARDSDDLLFLGRLRREAMLRGNPKPPKGMEPLKIALLGGYTLYPLHVMVEQSLAARGFLAETFVGQYGNYFHEILDEASGLHAFKPQVILLLPSESRCRYQGQLSDPADHQRNQVIQVCSEVLYLCRVAHERTQAVVFLGNFMPPSRMDLGAYRSRTLGSEWGFRKLVNLELGTKAPNYVHICDIEFLASRWGTLRSRDERAWLQSKQPGSADFLVEVAHEVAVMMRQLRTGPKKVLVTDLDNTLWGGTIGDDGLEGIDIGSNSARGEAYRAFQQYLVSLKDRGVLLAVCSKNSHEIAILPFRDHPEMVLRMWDFVAFKANWDPKPENLKAIVKELNLSLDSIVFVDDNPSEVEMVSKFLPDVTAIRLGPDPAEYVGQLQDLRLFDPLNITREDAERTRYYKEEQERRSLMAAAMDMSSYLSALCMTAELHEFRDVDMPRITQLINKSNQFNPTTRRRSQAELETLAKDPNYLCFTARLSDKFGDHGLIAAVIARINGKTIEVDTWVMSCRVLQRGVEQEIMNELVKLAMKRGCTRMTAAYLPTPKNGIVKDLYPKLGMKKIADDGTRTTYEIALSAYQPKLTEIDVQRRPHDRGGSNERAAGNL